MDAALVIAGGLIGGLVALVTQAIQMRAQERMTRMNLDHERSAREDERKAKIEDDLREHEREPLLKLLQLRDFGEEDDFHTLGRWEWMQDLAQQVDDEVLQRMAENEAEGLYVRRRAGYVLRTPKAARTDNGHDVTFRDHPTPSRYL
jgi:hypothetical protein